LELSTEKRICWRAIWGDGGNKVRIREGKRFIFLKREQNATLAIEP
jgi:hypothetical protein